MERELVEVFITHVEDEGPLLKLWAQTDRSTPTLIERTIDQLKPQFEEGVGIPEPSSLSLGQLCCAKYSDGIYYRARITRLASLSVGEVGVQFADYGNLETIALHNMRSFEGLRTVLSTIPDQATDFYLAGVVPTSGEWDPRSLKYVKDIICYVELKCLYVGHTEGLVTKHLIKLFYQNMDFASYLIDRSICVTMLLATQITVLQSVINKTTLPPLTLWPGVHPDVPPPLPMAQLMVTTAMAKACEKNLVESVMNRPGYGPSNLMSQIPPGMVSQPPPGMRPGASYPPMHPPPGMFQREYPTYSDGHHPNHRPPIQTQTPPPQVEVTASFETPHLEINTRHEVRVAFVEDGPNSFVISPKHMEVVLGDMLTEINSSPPTPLKKLPMTGSICLGRYSSDQSLCRAVVTNVLTDSCVVVYVDFGHSETLPYSEIFELPPKYIKNPSVMAIRFSHARVPDLEITPDVKRLFSDYVTGKYFTLCVVPSEGHRLQQYGVLYDHDQRRPVLDIIRSLVEARKICDYPKINNLQKGTTKPILVSFVESINNFFVQVEDSAEALTALMSDVLAHCEGDARKLKAADLRVRLLCCAQFAEDGQWYRAQITKIAKDGIYVNYVDYGNTEAVQLEAIREIKPDLVNRLKAQAVSCCLKNFKDVPVNEELINRFSELTADKNLIMQILDVCSNGCLIVELHDLTSSPPLSLSIELQKYAQPAVVEKSNRHPDQTSYMAPTHNEPERKPSGESRYNGQNSYGGSGDSKYNQGSRADTPTDWRAKGDGPRGGGDRGAAKIDTWEGSTENRGGGGRGDKKFTPANVRVGDTKAAQLIYAENPEDFYVQLTPDTALTELMADVAVAHDGGRGAALSALSRGTACIAQYAEDETWYRAAVLAVDDDRAKVHFVDYGNSDFVALENVKEIGPEFVAYPTQAVKCTLAGSLPRGSKWSDDEINDFILSIDGKPLEVKFVGEKNGVYSVVLKDVETGKVANEDFGAPAEAPPAHRPPPQPESPPYRPAPKPKQTPPPPQKPAQVFAGPEERLAAADFAPGHAATVCVSWFISPAHFYVQDTSQAGQLDRTMRDIQAAYAGTPANAVGLGAGAPVIAKYRGDNSLCRAEVSDPATHAVQYVDYGNRDLVDKLNVWRIEKRFLTLPKQAVACRLHGVEPPDAAADWPKSKDVDALFQDEAYECVVVGFDDGKYDVTLCHKGASVADQLVVKGLARLPVVEPEFVEPEIVETAIVKPSLEEPVEAALFVRQTLKVVIPYVEGIAKFYVHLEGNITEQVQALVDAHCAIPENLEPLPARRVKIGQLCLATSDGQQWYRARVADCAGTAGVYVVFIDYGDGDEVTADKLMRLPAHLAAYPPQAVECSLSGWEAASVEPEVEDLFKANNEGESAIIHVDSVEGDRLNVMVHTLEGNKQDLVANIGEGLQEVGRIPPLPILTQKPVVCVSHPGSPDSVWLQRLSDADALTDQLDRMFAFYETDGRGVEIGAVAAGLLCAAKSPTDEQWYRARVASVKPDAVLQVLFIDYGNCEDVGQADVKALDSEFYGSHAFAVEVALPVRRNANVAVDDYDLGAMTADLEFVAGFARRADGKWYAELVNGKEALSWKLVELGLELVEDYPFKKFIEELTKTPKLVPGVTFPAYVSHPGTPGELWIQRAADSEEIDLFQAGLQDSAEGLQVLVEPAAGDVCMAQFSEDGSWYRAVVLAVDETEAIVRFVDYGNTDVVDMAANPLKLLVGPQSTVEWYATRCSLSVAPMDEGFSEEAIERFAGMVAETETPLLARVVADGNVIDLSLGDVSFAATLIAEGLAVEHFPENSAFVSHVDSPAEFWLQYQSSTQRLEAMGARLEEAAGFEPLTPVVEGALCAAQFVDDEMWYRAKIVGVEEGGTAVHFVDYGNSSLTNEVHALPEELLAAAPLAKRCSLATEDGVQWTDEATAGFVEMTSEGATPFLVEIVSEGDPAIVILTDMSKKVVNEAVLDLVPVGPEEAVPEEKTADVVEENQTLELATEKSTSAEPVADLEVVESEDLSEVIPEVKTCDVEESHISSYTAVEESTLAENVADLEEGITCHVEESHISETAVEESALAENVADLEEGITCHVEESHMSETAVEESALAENVADLEEGIPDDVAEVIPEETTVDLEESQLVSAKESQTTGSAAEESTSAVLVADLAAVKLKDASEDIPEKTTGGDVVIESELVCAEGENKTSGSGVEDSISAKVPQVDAKEDSSEENSNAVCEPNDEVEKVLCEELTSLAVEGATASEPEPIVEVSEEQEIGSTEEPSDVTAPGVESTAVAAGSANVEESKGGLAQVDEMWQAMVNKSQTEPVIDDETFVSAEESDTSTVEDFTSPEKFLSLESSLHGDNSSDALPAPGGDAVCPTTPRRVSRPMTPHNERIVPGSVCRGVSQEEIDEYTFDPEVDGSDAEPEADDEDLLPKSCPATPVPRETLRAAASCEDFVPSPIRLRHNERIVPGSISSGSSVEEMTEAMGNGDADAGVRRDGADGGGNSIDVAKGIVRLVIEQSEASVMAKIKDGGEVSLVSENGSEGEPTEKEASNGVSAGNASEILEAE